jgi:energy-coupling factor transporter ATP-binding protein EcfA2
VKVSDLTLDFEKNGVYRLVGDNDVGKSAILRGINALFHNVSRSSYKEYISDWADTFIVEGWFYDGGYVKLSRGVNDYYEWSLPTGGNTLLKTDGKVPPELEEYFNLYTEKDKSKLTLNFNLQGDVLPFVDTSASDNFWLTQKALGTNILLNANKLLKKENQENQKLVKTTIDNIDYEMKISEKIANEIENDSYELNMLSDGIRVINEELAELEELYKASDKEIYLSELKSEFENIPILSESEIGELYNEANEYSLIKKYQDYALKIETTKNKIKVIDSVLEYFNLSELEQEIDIYNLLIKYKEKLLFILGLKAIDTSGSFNIRICSSGTFYIIRRL